MAQDIPVQLPEGWSNMVSDQGRQENGQSPLPVAPELHVTIGADGAYKMGTCEHCVLFEEGRPQRAWDASGDTELDFQRDQYFSLLAHLGIVMTDRQAYVCP